MMRSHAEKQFARRMIIVGRLLNTLKEYTEAFNAPMPMKIVSAKYARSLNAVGGMPEILNELIASGEIQVYLTRSGAKVVLPKDSSIIPPGIRL